MPVRAQGGGEGSHRCTLCGGLLSSQVRFKSALQSKERAKPKRAQGKEKAKAKAEGNGVKEVKGAKSGK